MAGRQDQYSAARSCLRMVRTDIRLPNRRIIICISRPGAEMKWFVLTIRSSWWSSRGVEILIDVVGQSLGCVTKFCLCILETPRTSKLLIAENCHLPTTWQFAAVFAVANFVAWSSLKVQRNINNPYRNPTLHKSIKVVMARQTSLQVTTPKLIFPPDNTVFGHSIWLRNGSMKSTVFRSAIEHMTRNNKYRSNSRKCHLVVVIP